MAPSDLRPAEVAAGPSSGCILSDSLGAGRGSGDGGSEDALSRSTLWALTNPTNFIIVVRIMGQPTVRLYAVYYYGLPVRGAVGRA
jgi:hypothetical protein